ncbi:MAG: hypothetical protein KGY75_10350, partial [Candidatus Cloacimonetes bacterium]|nr:hypothetical protein [Candidatus Cloacimonadota bacterium]
IACGSYYVVVRHRNHLAILSNFNCEFKNEGLPESLDLSNSSNIYDIYAIKEIGKGKCVICAGDINLDGIITTADYTIWYNEAVEGEIGYKSADLNLDGIVNTADYTKWFNNAVNGAHSGE